MSRRRARWEMWRYLLARPPLLVAMAYGSVLMAREQTLARMSRLAVRAEQDR